MKPDYTPEKITHLDEDEIFVFGSNLNGEHIGGAARVAYENFGALWGVGEGMTGRTYALPTLDKNMECVSSGALYESFKRFIEVVKNNPQFTFYLTKVGCGIAGWNLEEIRKIFWDSLGESNVFPHNLIIPYDFYYERSKPKMRSRYGLYKIPMEVLLKNKSQEVGELKSYIQELENEIFSLKNNKEEQREFRKEIKSEEMYKSIKRQNKNLQEIISNLRRDKNDLLQKVAHNYIMKKEEFQQKISQEEKMLEKLSNKARQALTEEEREMYHNQIVDTESAIECMKEELKKYD